MYPSRSYFLKELGVKLLPIRDVLFPHITTRGVALIKKGRCEGSQSADGLTEYGGKGGYQTRGVHGSS
jgi:hypothetical protein